MPRPKLSRADVASMRALYETDGWSSVEIATEYCITPQTVRHHLIRAGVTLRPANPPGPRNPARDAEIIRAYQEGVPMGEMLWRFAFVTPASVYRSTPEGRAQRAAQGRKTAEKRWGTKTRKEAA